MALQKCYCMISVRHYSRFVWMLPYLLMFNNQIQINARVLGSMPYFNALSLSYGSDVYFRVQTNLDF